MADIPKMKRFLTHILILLFSCAFTTMPAQNLTPEELQMIKKYAEQGDVNFQFDMGLCYYIGVGVSQNYSEAVKWFRKAAEQGLADAQFNLGICYLSGKGVTQNYSEAVKWFRKAAEQGDEIAQYNLGEMYYNGNGVTQNYSEAVKWYRKAAEQGYASAQIDLGTCYSSGKGVTQNYSEAVKWFRKAAEQGLAAAQYNLGICYYYGLGVTQNLSEAVKWYQKAAEQGYELAKEELKKLGIVSNSSTKPTTTPNKTSAAASNSNIKVLPKGFPSSIEKFSWEQRRNWNPADCEFSFRYIGEGNKTLTIDLGTLIEKVPSIFNIPPSSNINAGLDYLTSLHYTFFGDYMEKRTLSNRTSYYTTVYPSYSIVLSQVFVADKKQCDLATYGSSFPTRFNPSISFYQEKDGTVTGIIITANFGLTNLQENGNLNKNVEKKAIKEVTKYINDLISQFKKKGYKVEERYKNHFSIQADGQKLELDFNNKNGEVAIRIYRDYKTYKK